MDPSDPNLPYLVKLMSSNARPAGPSGCGCFVLALAAGVVVLLALAAMVHP